jgi:hypothetical protein
MYMENLEHLYEDKLQYKEKIEPLRINDSSKKRLWFSWNTTVQITEESSNRFSEKIELHLN